MQTHPLHVGLAGIGRFGRLYGQYLAQRAPRALPAATLRLREGSPLELAEIAACARA